MQNHHLTSVSTSLQKTARQFFFGCRTLFGQTKFDYSERSDSAKRQRSELSATRLQCKYTMQYLIELVYDPEPASLTIKDGITLCASTRLLLRHGIHSCQLSESLLAFNTERDRTVALLVLSSHKSYVAVAV